MVSMLTILRNGQIVFQGGCTILYFTRISISPHLYQHVIICLLLNFSDPNGYEISYCVLKLLLLNANHAEHFCKSFWLFETQVLSGTWHENIFSYPVGWLLSFLMVSFPGKRFLIFVKPYLSIFSFVILLLRPVSWWVCLIWGHEYLLLIF